MSLLLLLGGAPALTEHWAGVREGDYLTLLSPYTAPGGETVLVRVLSRSFTDGDAFEKLTLQFIDPIDVTTRLSLLGELGTMAPPPPQTQTATDQTAIVQEISDEVRALRMATVIIGEKIGSDTVDFGGGAFYINSAGNIIARRPDGTEATLV